MILQNPTVHLWCRHCKIPLSYTHYGLKYNLSAILFKASNTVKICSKCRNPMSIERIEASIISYEEKK